jgi:resuscitation-promoting factor RpfB
MRKISIIPLKSAGSLTALARKERKQPRFNATMQRFARLHRAVIPLVTFCLLLMVSVGGYLFFTHDNRVATTDSLVVIISHDKVEQTVPTRQTTVGELLHKLNIPLKEGDIVEPDASTEIKQDDFRINVYRAVPIEVVDNGHRTFTFSAATTPRSIAKQSGATLYAEDKLVTKPVTNFLEDGTLGQQVTIDRATPITFNLYGNTVNVRTQAKTVGDLLKEKNITLGKDDSVQPVAATPLTPGGQVFLLRQGTKITSVTEDIPMPQDVIVDNGLAFGTSAIRQQGSPGQKVITYQLNLQNGKEISRTAIQTVTTREPVKQIVVQGASLSGIKGDMALAGIAPGDYNYADYIIGNESGWCPTKAQGEHSCPAIPDNQFTSNGYGLCQATPGSKMASAGADWATNPVTQLKWCSGYATGRYGSWQAAYNHWVSSHNW